MPIIKGLSEKYQFHFFSDEYSGGNLEPIHVHVRYGSARAKVWIDGRVASNKGFGQKELNEITKLVVTHQLKIEEAWNEHFKR